MYLECPVPGNAVQSSTSSTQKMPNIRREQNRLMLIHTWKEDTAQLYSCIISLQLPDSCRNLIMEGLTKYYADHPWMIQEAIHWENMRRIHLLSIRLCTTEVGHLESKLDEIQRNSSLNLKVANIELGHQIATKGKIRWELCQWT